MVAHAAATCSGCGEEYRTTGYADEGLCPRCQQVEDEQYAVMTVDTEPWTYSRRAMQERLGITSDRDE